MMESLAKRWKTLSFVYANDVKIMYSNLSIMSHAHVIWDHHPSLTQVSLGSPNHYFLEYPKFPLIPRMPLLFSITPEMLLFFPIIPQMPLFFQSFLKWPSFVSNSQNALSPFPSFPTDPFFMEIFRCAIIFKKTVWKEGPLPWGVVECTPAIRCDQLWCSVPFRPTNRYWTRQYSGPWVCLWFFI